MPDHAIRILTHADLPAYYERAGYVAYGLQPRAIKVAGNYYDKLHVVLHLHPD
jgi:hypothetical protein